MPREVVEKFKEDWRNAPIEDMDRTILSFAEKLALTPARITQQDIESLKQAGVTDRAVSDVVQVVAYFSYINRIADGLGVDLEPEMTQQSRKH